MHKYYINEKHLYKTIGHLYYKHAYGRVLEVCKHKQRLVW